MIIGIMERNMMNVKKYMIDHSNILLVGPPFTPSLYLLMDTYLLLKYPLLTTIHMSYTISLFIIICSNILQLLFTNSHGNA